MELQRLGWNVATFSFAGTILFALLGMWGLFDQAKKVWLGRSGQCVPTTWIIIYLGISSSFFIYGADQWSIALIVQGFSRCPLSLAIFIGLVKFEGLKRREALLLAAMAVLVAYTFITPHKGLMFTVLNYLGVPAAMQQPLAIFREKSRGVASGRLIAIFVASALFWVAYGVAFDDLHIVLVCGAYLIVSITAMGLWLYYGKPPRAVTSNT